MSDELFAIEPTLSRRLKWMRDHDISMGEIMFSEDEPWIAWVGVLESGPSGNFAQASNEHDALIALAKANGWKLWNEL